MVRVAVLIPAVIMLLVPQDHVCVIAPLAVRVITKFRKPMNVCVSKQWDVHVKQIRNVLVE
jgi:hypothetical protein